MRSCHGTDVVIDAPRVLVPNRALDVGPGFSATSDRAQASRWAAAVTRRNRMDSPVVHVDVLPGEDLADLDVGRFATASAECLDFVAAQYVFASARALEHLTLIEVIADGGR